MSTARPPGPIAILVDAKGDVWVDVGNRWVQVEDPDDLERILERLAADGGQLRLLRDPGSPDDEDEPFDREQASGAGTAASILAMAEALGLATEVGLATGHEPLPVDD